MEEGGSLIDYSLRHIWQAGEAIGSVTLTIVPGKEMVADYVRSVLPGVDVRTCQFNPAYSEWPGSILSSEQLFAGRNVVLLPDSVIVMRSGEVLFERYREAFEAGEEVVFAYKAVGPADPITSLGALRVEGACVTDFCDKPDAGIASDFNAFWASFGFTGPVGPGLLAMMMRSVARERVDIAALDARVGAFPVADYLDLGTWPSIRRFLKGRADAD
ncbi:hypothetical protein [Stappia sp. MMSF_3263]|uniref:hypothetical protein n=1 Tax=Stappia sp. MMSF_3263 TaxID=3046693 RepID=UPI00273F7EF3|nr:hypothetical protein [Stappia sp. MMSF_3263]